MLSQHGHQSNQIVHTWGGKHKDGKVHETEWKWLEEIKAVRRNLSTFGSNRVNMMLGFGKRHEEETDEEIALMRQSRYGIGSKRTLQQAEEFTGINFRKKKMDVNRCGNLLWVPYEESPEYGVEETLSRGHAGEEVRPYVVKPDHGALFERELRFVEPATTDYKLLGGLVLAILAIALKVSTGKREKDESHKE